MKRFYRTAAVAKHDAGYALTLDGRPVQTPANNPLAVPTAALAEAIRAEWQAQGDTIDPASLRFTRLANTAIDRVRTRRAEVIDEVTRYAETDLLCYRAPEPVELVERQHAGWQPLLDWLARRYDTALAVTDTVAPAPQAPNAIAALRRAVARFDDFTLTGLHLVTAAAGSLVIALAVAEDEIGAERAFELSQVDETFQMEQWGEDAEAAARRAAIRADVLAAARFMELCRA